MCRFRISGSEAGLLFFECLDHSSWKEVKKKDSIGEHISSTGSRLTKECVREITEVFKSGGLHVYVDTIEVRIDTVEKLRGLRKEGEKTFSDTIERLIKEVSEK